jgi:hypothetical protein
MLRQQEGSLSKRESTSLRAINQIGGLGARNRLWTGYTALLARNLPFTAIQFPVFEYVKERLRKARARRRPDGSDRLLEVGLVSGGSAAVAGAFSAFLTTPSDVVKTRLMVGAGRDKGGTSGGGSSTQKTTKRGNWDVAKEIYQSKGVRGLFRGGSLRATWTALGSGLYLGTYEVSKLWLTRDKRDSEQGILRDL